MTEKEKIKELEKRIEFLEEYIKFITRPVIAPVYIPNPVYIPYIERRYPEWEITC